MRLWLAVTLLFLSVAPARPDTVLTCAGGDITVTAPTADSAQHVCDVARIARPQLQACHLPQTAPLRITVTDTLPPQHDRCLGLYDCREDVIGVLDTDALRQRVPPSSAFARLPPDILHDSLIVHEMTHALIFQKLGQDSGGLAANEYMAYAMQVEFLPEAMRQRFLATRSHTQPVTDDSINDLILKMAPDFFAIFAWQHFRQPDHGCALFDRLLTGSDPFQKPEP
ncbi:hypothetical protein KPG71_09425 [Roseovarius sp. PS-C2]|uniref:DUF6639 family protein n=1 Tax=Roseovarius sp. PS-C2 TaxID=2820814 RepID=UPI001C0C9421|nr:DUF6639 family protein [Roseovarius sp. PS-C2]MBU3260230.1 hypothetical protein [Roseovarius sp. PS-C2]